MPPLGAVNTRPPLIGRGRSERASSALREPHGAQGLVGLGDLLDLPAPDRLLDAQRPLDMNRAGAPAARVLGQAGFITGVHRLVAVANGYDVV
jgi:hypothetical protein